MIPHRGGFNCKAYIELTLQPFGQVTIQDKVVDWIVGPVANVSPTELASARVPLPN
jgi:hypothetical protein